MATTGADFLQGLNMILTAQQEKERFKLQQSLALMELAQRRRLADIGVVKESLTLAESTNKQLRTNIATDFLSRSGLVSYYVDPKQVEADKSPIDEMVTKLKRARGTGPGFSDNEAKQVARAMHAFYESKDPRAVVSLAKRYGDADAARIGGYGSERQTKLFRAMNKVSGEANLLDVSDQARDSLQIGRNIAQEKAEFMRGADKAYTIEKAIGQYDDISGALEYNLDFLQTETKDLAFSKEAEEQSITDAESRIQELSDRPDRTNEEEEELIRLPDIVSDMRDKVKDMTAEINRRKGAVVRKRQKEEEEEKVRGQVRGYRAGGGGRTV